MLISERVFVWSNLPKIGLTFPPSCSEPLKKTIFLSITLGEITQLTHFCELDHDDRAIPSTNKSRTQKKLSREKGVFSLLTGSFGTLEIVLKGWKEFPLPPEMVNKNTNTSGCFFGEISSKLHIYALGCSSNEQWKVKGLKKTGSPKLKTVMSSSWSLFEMPREHSNMYPPRRLTIRP